MSTDASTQPVNPLDTDPDFDPVAYINEPRWRTVSLGLERITELMERLGNPQDGMRFVHVAGTNGKGSTCAFVANILQTAGYRTGLFTSPYIIMFSERIRVDGQVIPDEDLRAITLVVREQAEQMDDHPTEFELMTAVALMYFAQRKCDICVLEVGLGGRYDSTNIIKNPEVCAIVPIALDHTDVLGDTIAEIAGEKAGIIKAGAHVASAPQVPEAREVIERVSAEQGCAVTFVDEDALSGTYDDFAYRDRAHLRIALLGSYQTSNAALALDVCDSLIERGFEISEDDIREGLATTSWPGRFELVAREPDFVVDGGHNPQGAAMLASSLERVFPDRDPLFVVGILGDKDYRAMLEAIADLGSAFVCIEPPNPRALPAADLAAALGEVLEARGDDATVEVAQSIPDGVARARQIAGPEGLVCAFGSLYSIAEIMKAV